MGVLGVYAGASKMMDEGTFKTRIQVKSLGHQAQDIFSRH